MSAIHYSIAEPSPAGRVRARCGQFTKSFTSDAAKVTCIACKRLLNPKNKKPETSMKHTTLTSTLLSFFVLAACGDVDPSDYASTGDTTTGEPATSITHPDDTGAEDGFSSTSSASTTSEGSSSGSESSSSTGDMATDSGDVVTDSTETGDAPPSTGTWSAVSIWLSSVPVMPLALAPASVTSTALLPFCSLITAAQYEV